jgi:hypothetical protein
MRTIRIALREDERNALLILAQGEKRDPRAQAAMIIRHELGRRGLLQSHAPTDDAIKR